MARKDNRVAEEFNSSNSVFALFVLLVSAILQSITLTTAYNTPQNKQNVSEPFRVAVLFSSPVDYLIS